MDIKDIDLRELQEARERFNLKPIPPIEHARCFECNSDECLNVTSDDVLICDECAVNHLHRFKAWGAY